MRWLIGSLALWATLTVAADAPPIPLPTGRYEFQHKFGEADHWRIPSITLIVEIIEDYVTVTNADSDEVFPFGVIDEGKLMWHEKRQRWIIGETDSDRFREDVGPCSAGPEFIDLEARIYWTC